MTKWKLVPVEPTPEMIKAGANVDCIITGIDEIDAPEDYKRVFMAMLEAAPTPAEAPADVAQTIPSNEQLAQILDGLDRCWGSESAKREFLRTWIRDWTVHKLSAAPTPAEISTTTNLEQISSSPATVEVQK